MALFNLHKASWLKSCCFRQQPLVNFLFLVLLFLLSSSFTIWNNSRDRCYDTSQLEDPAGALLTTDVGELLACSNIIHGEIVGEPGDLGKLLKQRTRKGLPERFYVNATKDCSAFIKERKFLTVALSEEEKNFPIAYSMVVHEKIEMFERLLRAVYMPQNVYCVHVDKKSPKEFIKAVKGIASCFPNVFVASKLERVIYASWSRVQADLNCMKDLLHSPVKWKYLLNTCGTDFPIKTNAEMVRALKMLNGRNTMESEKTPSGKKRRWEYHHTVSEEGVVQTETKKDPPPISTPMFSGNAYFVLSRAFVERLFTNTEAQALLAWERDTYSPDEHLWATLQRMPSMPGSSPHHIKYDQSDMNAIARLVKWSYDEGDTRKGAAYPLCNGGYRRAVCVYGARDLSWIIKQHHLIANKFDPEVDEVAIRCLEHHLRYKTLTDQPLHFSDKSEIKKR